MFKNTVCGKSRMNMSGLKISLISRIAVLGLLFSFCCCTTALGETSYIIVHAHNPEGVEIASIQGMSQNVEIYDGNNLIGYGAHDAASHNQPITINSGSHTIKVKFNGMTKEQIITLNPNETKVVTFAFERTEIKLEDILNFSLTASDSGEVPGWWLDYDYYVPPLPSRFSFNIYAGLKCCQGTFTVSGEVTYTSMHHHFLLNANLSWEDLYELGCWIDAAIIATGEEIGAIYPPHKIISINWLPTSNFYDYFIQGLLTGDLPGVTISDAEENYTFVPAARSYSPNTYFIKIFPANNREYTKLIINWDNLSTYYEHSIVCEVGAYQNGETPMNGYKNNFIEYNGSQNLKCSSVPYDLTGTGIKDGETPYPPVASFKLLKDVDGDILEKPMVGGNIIFDASESYDPDGTIVSYEWDFDDGPSENLTVPVVPHVFETPDAYTVTLTVTDNDGLTSSTSKELDLSLEPGDILLCRSDMSFVPGKEWTHAGMYVGNEQVVEALKGPGVIISPLSTWSWLNGMTYVRALRVKTDPVIKENAVAFASAQAQINKKYDSWSLLFNKKQSNGNMWYCSELVWAAYLNASDGQIDLDEIENPFWEETVTPDEIDLSRWVKMIGEHKEEKPETFWCWYRLVGGVAQCPVDLIIRDPAGRTLSKDINEIPNASYEEIDVDDDNDLDDFFTIELPAAGYYLISVVAELNATPTDTYSLEAKINGQTMVLAQDVQIQNIPSEPYIIESKLNPADFDNDGDVDFYDYAAFASRWMSADCHYPDWCEGKDLDYSGLVDFMDLSVFTENWLWAKIPADIDIDGNVDFADFALFADDWLETDCEESNNWCEGTDFDHSGSVDMLDLATFARYWLEGI